MKSQLRILLIATTPLAFAPTTPAADSTTAPATVPASQPVHNTVGVDIIKSSENPDHSLTLLYEWKDRDGKRVQRSVIVNQNTVIGVDGKLKTMADLTPDVLKKKSVATVGPDGVTAVNLRFGRAMVQVTREQLTPAQADALTAAAPKATPASDAALDKRVDGIVASLNLNDPAREARLKKVLTTNLRDVRDSHNAGFAPAKSVRADLTAGLQADLTPEQVDAVKNKLTVNKLPVTFKAYHDIVPNLTPEDDKEILRLLTLAREDCLDVKNPDEMATVFKPYKTQIENYLNAHGHDWRKSYKEFVDRQNGATQQPTTAPASAG